MVGLLHEPNAPSARSENVNQSGMKGFRLAPLRRTGAPSTHKDTDDKVYSAKSNCMVIEFRTKMRDMKDEMFL